MKPRLLKTFIDLVKINETSGQEKEVVKYVRNRLEKLKIRVCTDSYGNLIGYWPGEGNPLLLSTHMDIPEPMRNFDYRIKENIVTANGDSILGADPKSGLAVILELVSYLAERKIKTRPIEIVLTKEEERGLVGARNLDYALVSAKEGIVLDESGGCNNMVVKAPTFCKLSIFIKGKAAHISEPEKGVNALKIAAEAITKLELGLIKPGVTFNIGIFRSGTAANTVPDSAEMEADVRSFDEVKIKQAVAEIKKALTDTANKYGGKAKIVSEYGYFGYEIAKRSDLIKKLKRTYIKLGMKPNFLTTYGGSDANIFNRKGIMCVAIGSGYYNPHQYTEYVNLSDMETLMNFLVEYISIRRLSAGAEIRLT